MSGDESGEQVYYCAQRLCGAMCVVNERWDQVSHEATGWTFEADEARCPAHQPEGPSELDVLVKIRDLLESANEMLAQQHVCGHGTRGYCPYCLRRLLDGGTVD